MIPIEEFRPGRDDVIARGSRFEAESEVDVGPAIESGGGSRSGVRCTAEARIALRGGNELGAETFAVVGSEDRHEDILLRKNGTPGKQLQPSAPEIQLASWCSAPRKSARSPRMTQRVRITTIATNTIASTPAT